jgi:ferredoxin
VSLFNAAERFAAMDHSTVILAKGRCLHGRSRFSSCEACFTICPSQAISPGKPPTLDQDRCASCLACLPVCPVGAYSADDAVSSLLSTASRLEGSSLELICEKNPHAAKGADAETVGVRMRGCLTGLGDATYLALAALGLEKILVRMDACDTCEWKVLFPKLTEQVDHAHQLLQAWGKVDSIICIQGEPEVERPLWEAANPPLSRRDLFLMIARQGKVAMARAIEIERKVNGELPGRNRLRILGTLAHLPVPMEDSITLQDMDYAGLVISEKCTACLACVRICPTKALFFKKSEDETSFTMQFTAGNCIGCELCMRACVPAAISIDHSPTFKQVFGEKMVIVKEGKLAKCESCGVLMTARQDISICTVCEYMQQHPLGAAINPDR